MLQGVGNAMVSWGPEKKAEEMRVGIFPHVLKDPVVGKMNFVQCVTFNILSVFNT